MSYETGLPRSAPHILQHQPSHTCWLCWAPSPGLREGAGMGKDFERTNQGKPQPAAWAGLAEPGWGWLQNGGGKELGLVVRLRNYSSARAFWVGWPSTQERGEDDYVCVYFFCPLIKTCNCLIPRSCHHCNSWGLWAPAECCRAGAEDKVCGWWWGAGFSVGSLWPHRAECQLQ